MTTDGLHQAAGDADGQRALAAALRAAMQVTSPSDLCRAVLREANTVVPFDFGLVVRLAEAQAIVVGIYPAPVAGIEAGVAWTSLDATERELLRIARR